MEKYFANLISDNLFPFNTYRTHSAIQLTEKTANNYLKILRRDIEVLIGIVQFRQVLFGLGSSSFPLAKVIYILKNDSGIFNSINRVNELIKELKDERKKVISSIFELGITNNETRFFKIVDWVKLLNDLLSEDGQIRKNRFTFTKPEDLKIKLSSFYKGSENILKEISRLFYEHSFCISNKSTNILPRRNILLIGPSGCGKTYIIEKLSELLNFAFISFDVTKMARTGYVGDKVEDILATLYSKSGSLERMNGGIVFIDEIDKLAANLQYGSAEISTTGVQLDLLKFIEGHNYRFKVKEDRDYKEKYLQFDSRNLAIICGGAFEGLDLILDKRNKFNNLGFTNVQKDQLTNTDNIYVDDLIKYGLIKEFAARFQIIISMPERKPEDLYEILVKAEDSVLKNYIEYFNHHGCKLTLEDAALWEIANYSYLQKTGARGLVRIIEKVLPMYEVGNKELIKLVITKDYVINKLHNW